MGRIPMLVVVIVVAFAVGVYFARRVRDFLRAKREESKNELRKLAQDASEEAHKL